MDDKRTELIQVSSGLFRKGGFKKTSIADVAKAADIAVGSFYKYFESKEELFFYVYLRENEMLKRRLFASVSREDDPVSLVTRLVAENAMEMNNNAILREWYNRDLMTKLETFFQKQGGIDNIEQMANAGTRDMVLRWQTEGSLRNDLDVEFILAIFRAIPYIDLHKSDIGPEHFPQVLEKIVEFIMNGLKMDT